MKDVKAAGKSEHYRALKDLLKVIKRGGKGVGPVVPMTPETMEKIYLQMWQHHRPRTLI